MSDNPRRGQDGYVGLSVGFQERIPVPTLAGVSAALYDFNLLYELGLVLSVPDYAGRSFSPIAFWRRNGRGIESEHRMLVKGLTHDSPLELAVLIPTAVAATGGGLWAFWQMIERVIDRRLNRAILVAKLREAQADARKADAEADAAESIAARERLQLREAIEGAGPDELAPAAYVDRVVRRVQRGELMPRRFELEGTRLDLPYE